MSTIKLAIIGAGKVARDYHVPTISRSSAFELVAAASLHGRLDNVRHYESVEALLEQADVDAVAICTPPQARYAIARRALEHGCHVFLEKPPATTLGEVDALIGLAREKKVTLFAGWHSAEAACIKPAREWLAGRRIQRIDVQWKEDVRVWHRGQSWIWGAGGLGVFDPGINGLSLLTCLVPGELLVRDAELVFPSNCHAPVAATLELESTHGVPIHAEFDFLKTGTQSWDIDIHTQTGHLQLSMGGAVMRIDGATVLSGRDLEFEYEQLYARFAELIAQGAMKVDVAPLRLVADAFLIARRVEAAPFVE